MSHLNQPGEPPLSHQNHAIHMGRAAASRLSPPHIQPWLTPWLNCHPPEEVAGHRWSRSPFRARQASPPGSFEPRDPAAIHAAIHRQDPGGSLAGSPWLTRSTRRPLRAWMNACIHAFVHGSRMDNMLISWDNHGRAAVPPSIGDENSVEFQPLLNRVHHGQEG